MIIAIDESGSFNADSSERHFFVAAHIRQRKTLYKIKKTQFLEWESSLPKVLKNHKGEIKSSSLTDSHLADFARKIVCSHYYIGITPYAICPSQNPESVVDKYREAMVRSIREGAKEAAGLGRKVQTGIYEDFANWVNKLSYTQYLKIYTLGACIGESLVNSVGHAVTGGYDEELVRIKFLLDRDFIKEPRPNTFWHELLRNQLYDHSTRHPLPLLNQWGRKGHPFLEKYAAAGYLNFNKLFWQECSFVVSHEYFEIRIADAIVTILSRHFNKKTCHKAFALIRPCFLARGKVTQIVLEDFDLSKWRYNPEDNPWRKAPEQAFGTWKDDAR